MDTEFSTEGNADGRNRTVTKWELPKMLHADVRVVVTHAERYTDNISVMDYRPEQSDIYVTACFPTENM